MLNYCVDTKENLVEILCFRHFAKHFMFNSEDKKTEISTSKATLTFRWQLILSVGTQTEDKGFG